LSFIRKKPNIPHGIRTLKISTRYFAYISYSHVDVRFAAWLQRALETWPIPTQFYAKLGFSRIKPVFRDRSDLRVSSNLRESLTQALEQSDALVVVCSRHAAQSKWVDEEIRQFRQLHGDSRIFAIIAADSPPDCFPHSLVFDEDGNQLEPIAADSRRAFDGRRDALLKIIAGLLNLEVDDLKRRDLRHQYRRMTVAAVSAAGVAAVTLALAITAYDARNDANRRREQAEDLIAFMLGDLRERLEPIGRLDVLDAVGDKSQEYFASLEDDDLTQEALLGRARALRQIGEVRMSQGDLEQALTAFQLSNDQASRLLESYPQPEIIEFEVSQSHFWIGYVHYERGEVADARRQFESYLELSQVLFQRDLANPDYQLEVAYAHSNLGSLELKENRFVEAESHFRKTAAINEELVAASPEDIGPKQALAETVSWLGEIAKQSGDITAAIAWFQHEYDLRTAIVSATDDMAQVEKLADAAMLLGHEQMLAGQLQLAAQLIEQAHSLGGQLRQHDPDNVRWQRLYAFSMLELSRVAVLINDLPGALTSVKNATGELRRLADAEMQHSQRQTDYLSALLQKARVLRLMTDDAGAHEAVKEALVRLDRPEAPVDAPTNALLVAGLHLLDGDLLAKAGNASAAAQAWSAGLASLDLLPEVGQECLKMLTQKVLLERTKNEQKALEIGNQIARLGWRDGWDRALTRTLIEAVP
jgi:tetratricopeptide (TPR) repeat protein